MRGWIALVVVAATTSVAIASPGVIFIPPAEVDVGAQAPIGNVLVTSVSGRAEPLSGAEGQA